MIKDLKIEIDHANLALNNLNIKKENKKYIFKLFENLDCKEFEEQIFILKHLRTLEVPKVVLNSQTFYKANLLVSSLLLKVRL